MLICAVVFFFCCAKAFWFDVFYFCFPVHVFGVISKKIIVKTNIKKYFPNVFVYDFYSFKSRVLVFRPLWTDFHIWHKVGVQFYSFSCGYPAFTSFIEEIILSQLCIFGILVEDMLNIYMYVFFWAPYPIAFIYMSVFMPEPNCFNYYSFVIYFESGIVMSPALFFSLMGILWIPMNFRIVLFFPVSIKNATGVLIGAHWIYSKSLVKWPCY